MGINLFPRNLFLPEIIPHPKKNMLKKNLEVLRILESGLF
jgi:hypothetical protein